MNSIEASVILLQFKKKQNDAFEEMKQKDIKDHNDIEKLLEECRKDMLDDDDDDELYSDCESED